MTQNRFTRPLIAPPSAPCADAAADSTDAMVPKEPRPLQGLPILSYRLALSPLSPPGAAAKVK